MQTAEEILENHRNSGREDWIYCEDALKAMETYANQFKQQDNWISVDTGVLPKLKEGYVFELYWNGSKDKLIEYGIKYIQPFPQSPKQLNTKKIN